MPAPYTGRVELDQVFAVTAAGFEVLGAVALVAGFVVAVVLGIRSLLRREGGAAAFGMLRTTLGGAILLGLELLVAGDLIRTISKPTLEDAVVLGIIVLIRTVLSFSIQVEIDGVLPWRRALTTSGAQVVASQVARDAQNARDAALERD